MRGIMLDQTLARVPSDRFHHGEAMLSAVLRCDVADALARRGLDGIDVRVRDGAVAVCGTVRRRSDREAVLAAVRGIQGVRRIDDQLRVTSP